MNEVSMLMYLLSQRRNTFQIGATREEILKALNLTYKNKDIHFHDIIKNLADYLNPIGLHINFNPIDKHWYFNFDPELSNLISANPFQDKPKLAATLFSVLVASLTSTDAVKIGEIKKLRKKKGVLEDLKQLEKKGYLIINKDRNSVALTSLIGYQLDIQKLFSKLTLKLRKEKTKAD
ncbi:MAG: hypothetical protein GF317_25100 [Candidatus Lokiarchaeota archaeon]|nr:hypothetical protein [Candidatus Lokiarchaeota archaeon]MBD3202637.1 hypothetical protein [Candidatus Lokiarchaeota archaeon]